jgi:hypothetical protein
LAKPRISKAERTRKVVKIRALVMAAAKRVSQFQTVIIHCVAHFLSKFAAINFVDKQWIYESLECILDIVSMEQGALYGCDN